MVMMRTLIPGQKMTKRMSRSKSVSNTTLNFKSKFERAFSQRLLQLKRQGLLAGWYYEKDKLTYTLEHNYLTDFKLLGKNGKVIYIETKGYFKPKDRTKHKKIREQHPEKDIRFVFMNSKTRLNKSSNTTYGSWCTKYGFKYTDKVIPKEWLEELNGRS